MTRGFLTLAFGRPFYYEMARSLVLSARKHGRTLPFAVVTDSKDKGFLSLFDTVIPYRKEYGKGVVQKLHLDEYAPFDQTIFVDADSLFFKSPRIISDFFEDARGFAVCGKGYVRRGDTYYSVRDVDAFLAAVGIGKFPLFNSGLFAFDKSTAAKAVFSSARVVFSMRQTCGLKEFKSAPANDEPIFAAAMELCGTKMLTDNGTLLTVMSDNACDIGTVKTALVHFNIYSQDSFVYARERLRLVFAGVPGGCFLAGVIARVESTLRNAAANTREWFLAKVVFPLWGIYRKIFPKKGTHA